MATRNGRIQQSRFEQARIYRNAYSLPTPALFIDRDGVLIKDAHHIRNPSQVQLLPGAKELLKNANRCGIPVIIVTNQSGISRGYFDWNDYNLVTDRMLMLFGGSIEVDAIYSNGYGPDDQPADWRKPKPGMLFEASRVLNLSLAKSILIGDRLSDLQAGLSACVPFLFHVATGYGVGERDQVIRWSSELQANVTSKTFHNILYLETLLQFPFNLLSKIQ